MPTRSDPLLTHSAPHSLLYACPILRNAGRSELLRRTLSSTPSLSPLVLSISLHCSSQQDPGHPSSLSPLLELTKPQGLELGSPLLSRHGEASRELLELLLVWKEEITSWSYGYVAASPIGVTLPLLKAFANLTVLDLTKVSIGATPAGPAPPYRLSSASFSCMAHLDPASLSWLLGQPARLRALSLDQVSLDCTSTGLQETLSPHLGELRWLTLREVDCTLDAIARTQLYERTWDLNPLLSLTTHLIDLTFGDQLASAVVPGPEADIRAIEPLRLPATLKRLELRGRWMYCWLRIGEVLAMMKGGAPGLEDLRLVGPFVSDLPLKRVQTECTRLGVALEVRRSFGTPI